MRRSRTSRSASSVIPRPQALADEAADKRLQILRLVGACGSISAAARQAGVSYKAAWQAVDTLSNLAGADLVERAVGGRGGGGARLSPAGHRLLEVADWMDGARREAARRLKQPRASPAAPAREGPPETPAAALGALALRTSLRNQLPCHVHALQRRRGAVDVTLALPGGSLLGARITRESAELLGLSKGSALLAMFKATAVDIVAGAPAVPSADGLHRIVGAVTRRTRASGRGEVVLRTPWGASVVGFANDQRSLAPGAHAHAVLDAATVVLAVPG